MKIKKLYHIVSKSQPWTMAVRTLEDDLMIFEPEPVRPLTEKDLTRFSGFGVEDIFGYEAKKEMYAVYGLEKVEGNSMNKREGIGDESKRYAKDSVIERLAVACMEPGGGFREGLNFDEVYEQTAELHEAEQIAIRKTELLNLPTDEHDDFEGAWMSCEYTAEKQGFMNGFRIGVRLMMESIDSMKGDHTSLLQVLSRIAKETVTTSQDGTCQN